MMQAEALDQILSDWHEWARADKGVRGFAPRSLVTGDYQTSRQYDDLSGALDGDLHHRTMRSVDFQVSEMHNPHRTAVHVIARNAATGVMAWSSPRLPAGDELVVILAEARKQIYGRLLTCGILYAPQTRNRAVTQRAARLANA